MKNPRGTAKQLRKTVEELSIMLKKIFSKIKRKTRTNTEPTPKKQKKAPCDCGNCTCQKTEGCFKKESTHIE